MAIRINRSTSPPEATLVATVTGGPTGGTFTIESPSGGSVTLQHNATAEQVALAVYDLEIAGKLPKLIVPLGGIVL